MIILAADTSTSQGSVALREPKGAVLREDLDSTRPHSETLLPGVERVLFRAGFTRKDVQAIAVGIGPGAFTGLRVGLATFKAWAAASGLPLIPVVSMDAVAWPLLREGTPTVVLTDARKGEVYAAYYPSLEEGALPRRQGEMMLLPYNEVSSWVSSLNDPDVHLVGTGLSLLEEKGLLNDIEDVEAGSGAPDAAWVLALGEVLFSLGRTVEPSGLIPCYVRPPDARKPSPGKVVTGFPNTDDCAGS
ncbi:MAG: tRNA (adenosine(37)-N6)-threonylcarbamoyltransferase complex dimerization subunit type 1 TsaB [bacterium]|nr:tRNA (adenosine(37)-N6)-threonylcarbamoyltransferase complex dimerization subunit type 1 TsaB [bacterium]MDT8365350.1 tRNA (adenosine(37)-N6)-threonylcarbamoyltransferase complex dimerization subunit type 1 TsaB [bacterium]